MNIIKNLLSSKIIPEYKEEFEKENYTLSLSRLRVICLAFVILSFYFFYVDIIMYKSVNNIAFRTTSTLIHSIGFIISISILFFYRSMKSNFNINLVKLITRCSIITLLIIGSLSSINSQRLTGNIDAYIIFTLIAATAFPFEPVFMFFCFLVNHILLLVGMIVLSQNYYSLITKQINSTALFVLSFLFCYSLYRHRVMDFSNKYTISQSESNFKKLFSVNPIPLFISKYEDGQIIMANDKAYKFYGYNKEEFHKILAKNLYKDEKDRSFMLTKLHNSDKFENYIVEQKDKLCKTKWVIANYELIEYHGENCVLTCVTDITEIKKIENELLDHASIDALTGVLNRRIGLDLLKNKIRISQHESSSLVICFIDIDGLKFVNDTYGHNEGDFLISKVASIIKENISTMDILFRYGGDEFIILFPNKNEQFVEYIWSNIKSEFNRLNKLNLKPYKLSSSHGLFEYDGSINLTVEQILDLADKKMYFEKTNKKLNRN